MKRITSDPGAKPARRRKAFEAFMAKHALVPAEWARAAGLSTPNAIYNFLHGRSKSLGQETLERLAKAVPHASITEIMGEGLPTGVSAQTIAVRLAAGVGHWRAGYEAQIDPEPKMALPPGVAAEEAAVILDRHADLVYPAGSYVGVLPLASMPRPLRAGDMVLTHRIRDGRHEVTVRVLEVKTCGQGVETAQLACRSTEARFRTRIEIPWPYRGESFEVDGDIIELRGRVTIMVLLYDRD